MSETPIVETKLGSDLGLGERMTRYLLGRLVRGMSDSPVAFDVRLPDGHVQHFGQGGPSFHVVANNGKGVRALASLDQLRIGEAYLAGDLDIDGDMVSPFELRRVLADQHWLTAAWRFVQPLLYGQVHTNQQAIRSHYDIDPEFFLAFLDPKTPLYTQGVYADSSEALDVATLRKFDYCFNGLGLKPGDHILEVGPGWGAWFEYASARGVKCTGISISQFSIDYLNRRSRTLGYDWELVYSDLLAYQTARKYDAIVIMGVIEHLPQYDKVLAKFMSMLKPGGKIFLDGSAHSKKYELCSYMVKHIYPGNHSFLALHDLMTAMAATPLRVTELFNDTYSYFLTFRQWARNFDANREAVIKRFGEFNYRRFRLYLWGATYEFLHGYLDCYRMIIQDPGPDAAAPG